MLRPWPAAAFQASTTKTTKLVKSCATAPLTRLTARFGCAFWWRVQMVGKAGNLVWSGAVTLLLAAAPAMAARVVVMTPANIRTALAAVQPGDTLRMEGVFNTTILIRNRDFGGVHVDASAATIQAGIRLSRVHNISFTGGTWLPAGTSGTGDAIRVEDSSHVSFSDGFVTGIGRRLGSGARILRSSFVTVRDSLYDGLRNGVILHSSTDSLVTYVRHENGGEDGMKILDSQRIIASHNSCTGFSPLPGYHPDCIQLWSIANRPLQSDIFILNNLAIGPQQGFVSFDPQTLSGTRLTFAGNYVATSSGHTITCLGCTDSRFEDNVVVTLSDARWLAPLRVTGPGTGNVFDTNSYVDLRGQVGATLPQRVLSSLIPSFGGLVGSNWADRDFAQMVMTASASASPNSVPEPATWGLLLAGFAMIGQRLRRRRGRPQYFAA
jgi:hypothetical protein